MSERHLPTSTPTASVSQHASEQVEGASSLPVVPDVVAIAQLWADQFQHMTTLAIAGGGGLLIALQAGLVRASGRFFFAIVLLGSAALLSIIGQANVVDDATKGLPPGKGPRVIRNLTFMTFGAGIYGVVKLFV